MVALQEDGCVAHSSLKTTEMLVEVSGMKASPVDQAGLAEFTGTSAPKRSSLCGRQECGSVNRATVLSEELVQESSWLTILLAHPRPATLGCLLFGKQWLILCI